MIRYYLKAIVGSLIIFLLLGSSYVLVRARLKKHETVVQGSSQDKEIKTPSDNRKVQQKQEDIEELKKKTEVKLREAEVVKETAKNRKEIKEPVEETRQKQEKVLTAGEKLKIAEKKMLAAQKKAKLAEEELALVKKQAAIARAEIKEKRSILYRKLLQTGLVILIGYFLIFLIVSIINRSIDDVKVRHLLRKNVIYLFNIVIILYIFFIWIQNINSITVFLSVIGAGLALALQEVILCIAGWFLILVRRPFEVGDRIELGGVKGDVIDVRLFQTSLLEIGNWVEADQSTGRIVNIPNSALFKKENYNYSRGFEFIWNEIKILVTFESDWKRAEEIMLNHATRETRETETIVSEKIKYMSRHYMIHYEKFTPIVYVDIKNSGIELSLRYLTEARRRRATHDTLCRAILEDFEKEEKVNFAYPTYRIVR